MYVISGRINSSLDGINEILDQRDEKALLSLAEEQVSFGAECLDFNSGTRFQTEADDMATRGGAEAMGSGAGVLAEGAPADLAVLDTDGMHFMETTGQKVNLIVYCAKSADVETVMDRVNTALLYGASVRWLVDCDDSEIESIIDTLPFNASRRFGEKFIDIFEEGKRDFYLVDKDIHTIARFEITNLSSGHTFRSGEFREDLLEESLFH